MKRYLNTHRNHNNYKLHVHLIVYSRKHLNYLYYIVVHQPHYQHKYMILHYPSDNSKQDIHFQNRNRIQVQYLYSWNIYFFTATSTSLSILTRNISINASGGFTFFTTRSVKSGAKAPKRVGGGAVFPLRKRYFKTSFISGLFST